MHISARTDADQHGAPIRLVSCPICGHKLVDVQHIVGIALLRIKCKRCRAFIQISIKGE